MHMQGLHLTADLYQCRCQDAWLTNAQQLCEWCVQAARAAGLQPIEQVFHAIPASGPESAGVAAAVLLAQSHVCLHTWPGQRAVTLDVYVGALDAGHAAQARDLMTALIDRFQPEWTEQRSMDRGDGG